MLLKKIYQISLAVAIFAFGSLFSAGAALAIPPENPNAGNLIVNFRPNPMFSDGNLLPGDTRTGKAEVINNTGETKRIATEAINYPKNILGNVPDNDLSRALTIIIRENGSDLYGGSSPTGAKTLFDFYKNGETYLSDVSSGGRTKTYEFIISFPENAEDKWNPENSNPPTTSFNIIVGFQGEEGGVKYCNNNGIQDNGETGIDCGGGGCPACNGGGGGGGGSLPPGLTIQYEDTVTVGANYAEIEWWTSYKATSQVVYSSKCEYEGTCTEGKEYKFDFNDNQWSFGLPPKYGYKYTTEEMNYPYPDGPNKVTYRKIQIYGLTSGTTYYFRCISHASPPTVSREHSFTTLALADGGNSDSANPSPQENGAGQEGDNGGIGGIYPSVRGAADAVSGFINSLIGNKTENVEGRVAGAEENKNADESKAGESETDIVKPAAETGNEAAGECGKYPEHFLWLIVLLLLIIIILLYYIYQNKKRTQRINNG